MKRMRAYLFLIIFIRVTILSQSNFSIIHGVIRETKTFQPINLAEVYISGTTIGTTTDKNGYYEIKEIPAGKNTIVVTITGYESQSREVYLFNREKKEENFILQEKIYNLSSVEVVASSPELWKEQLEKFKDYFLGITPNAEDCIIKNETEINFFEDEKIFSATFPKTLEITNYALGYKLECIVHDFSYEKDTKTFHYKVFPRFTDIAEKEGTKKWYKQMMRRKGAYLGSARYVMERIIRNELGSRDLVLTLWEDPKWPSNRIVEDADEILTYNSFTNTYTLKFIDYLKIEIENNLESVEPSWLYLPSGKAEIDIYGNFINTNEFIIRGGLGKKGMADLLPKYYEIE